MPTSEAESEAHSQDGPKRRKRDQQSSSAKVSRTTHACEPCRERKARCDGQKPACARCERLGTRCWYGLAKGDKKQNMVDELTQRVVYYESLLESRNRGFLENSSTPNQTPEDIQQQGIAVPADARSESSSNHVRPAGSGSSSVVPDKGKLPLSPRLRSTSGRHESRRNAEDVHDAHATAVSTLFEASSLSPTSRRSATVALERPRFPSTNDLSDNSSRLEAQPTFGGLGTDTPVKPRIDGSRRYRVTNACIECKKRRRKVSPC